MLFHVRLQSLVSFPIVLHYVSFNRPSLLFPSGVHRKAAICSVAADIGHTCPSLLHLLLFICVAMDMVSLLHSRSLFVIMLGQHTPSILRRHLFWNVLSMCAGVLSVVSTLNHIILNRTLLTLLLYSLNLVFCLGK